MGPPSGYVLRMCNGGPDAFAHNGCVRVCGRTIGLGAPMGCVGEKDFSKEGPNAGVIGVSIPKVIPTVGSPNLQFVVKLLILLNKIKMAEGVGFEPTVALRLLLISSQMR